MAPPSAPPGGGSAPTGGKAPPGGGYCCAYEGINVLSGMVPIIISRGTSRSKAGPAGSTSNYKSTNTKLM